MIEKEKIAVKRISHVYRTDAWGKTDQPAFLNIAAEVQSDLNPEELLGCVINIEKAMGRTRDEKWGPRIIDIDILFFGNEIIALTDLEIPHPGISSRNFVLVPMNDIAPEFFHPVLKKTMATLLEECPDRSGYTNEGALTR